ncbi:MAG: NAD(P)H-hydrate dehydratase [Planctomycetota bacterium]
MIDLSNTPLPQLPPRDPTSHKGDFGRGIIVGGSRGMAGAPAMAGVACLRSGAGLVTVAAPQSLMTAIAVHSPALMTLPLVEDDGGLAHWANAIDLESISDRYDAWAIGPGLGSPEANATLAARLYSGWLSPLVVDADALNAVVEFERTRGPVLASPPGPRVLTPHAGEFARLVRDPGLAAMATGGDDQRVEAAAALTHRDDNRQTVVLLKGHRTVVTDGEHFAINTTGNPGMATGGSGDVLTGVLTALLCQGLSPLDAARLAAHVHGLAGDLAAEALGQVSLIATDLIDRLPAAFQMLERSGD